MLLDAPRRLPAGAAVTAVIDADHPVRRKALLGQAAETTAVARNPVKADDGVAGPIPPLCDAQLHESTSLPKCAATAIA